MQGLCVTVQNGQYLGFAHPILLLISPTALTAVQLLQQALTETLALPCQFKYIHYNVLCSKAHRMLGLPCCLFSSSCSAGAKKLLYMTLVRSQLIFCSPIWCPYSLKDIHSH